MKKLAAEFKKFIMRGNVVDMAVGVIVGSAFTAIVTALTQKIFMPLVNWLIAFITGGQGMEGVITMLSPAYDADGLLDLTKSIYIDWGAFITAVINFIIIAVILFIIVKTINNLREFSKPDYFGYTKEEYIKLRKAGNSRKQVKALAVKRDEEAAAKKAEEEAEAARKAAEPTTTEKLLAEILETLKKERG